MKILITGGNGQLGTELNKALESGKTELGVYWPQPMDVEVSCIDIEDLDIARLSKVREKVTEFQPDIIINCAAYTNVDKCETDQDSAFSVNAIGPRNLAVAAEAIGCKLIHISTDYVFSGEGCVPKSEWDLCAPNSIYGHTKRLGEEYVMAFCKRSFIIRTAWLYGYRGNNFVKTILRNAKEKPELFVVNDQRGNPTNAADVAHHILKLAITEEYGIYHCTCGGECTWYEFAKEIVRLSGLGCIVNPCDTKDYPRPARRPAYSALDNRMLRCTVGDETRLWGDALAAYMAHYDKGSGEIAE